MQHVDLYENDLMAIYNCESDWPICLYDFTYQASNPEQIVMRVGHDLHSLIKPDHFFNKCVSGRVRDAEGKEPIFGMPKEKSQKTKDLELVIERNKHLCEPENYWEVSDTAHNFVKNFKHLYQIKDKGLFKNENFNFDIDDVKDIIKKVEMFVADVSASLTDDQIAQFSKVIEEEAKQREKVMDEISQKEKAKLAKESKAKAT